MNADNARCKHKYIVGYAFRMPGLFSRSLPCDNCGCSIQLSLPWRIAYWIVDIIGYIIAYAIAFKISKSINIKFFGGSFIVLILVLSLIILAFQQVNRLILRYAKWIGIEKK